MELSHSTPGKVITVKILAPMPLRKEIMINKRKLDEVIDIATFKPEKECGYTFEQYLYDPKCQEHVDEFVNAALMPRVLANYLYEDCYYDDIETVKANLDYINLRMKKIDTSMNWADISMEEILENIECQKEKDANKAEKSVDVLDLLFQKDDSEWHYL